MGAGKAAAGRPVGGLGDLRRRAGVQATCTRVGLHSVHSRADSFDNLPRPALPKRQTVGQKTNVETSVFPERYTKSDRHTPIVGREQYQICPWVVRSWGTGVR